VNNTDVEAPNHCCKPKLDINCKLVPHFWLECCTRINKDVDNDPWTFALGEIRFCIMCTVECSSHILLWKDSSHSHMCCCRQKKMSHNIPQAITQHRQLLYTLGISWSFSLAFWNWS